MSLYILIPPSERKLPTPEGRTDDPIPEAIANDTKRVLAKFSRKPKAELQRIYGMRTEALARAVHTKNQRYAQSSTLKAIERYRGVMYDAIDYPGLTRQKDADQRLIVLSAFFGAIAADTPIPDYKLPMQSFLATYWRPINTARLQALADGQPVLNLLPQAHQRAIAYDPYITVDFRVEGGRRSSGHFGKTVRGKFVRWLIENQIDDPADFQGFCEDGYRFDGKDFVQD